MKMIQFISEASKLSARRVWIMQYAKVRKSPVLMIGASR